MRKEGRVLLAISALKESQIQTVRQAARHFQVPERLKPPSDDDSMV